MSVQVGDELWVKLEVASPQTCCIDDETGAQGVMMWAYGGVAWDVDEHDAPIMESQQGSEWLPDSPALIPISRWLAETPDAVAVLHELASIAEAQLIPKSMYRAPALALIAALEEGTR